MKRKLFNIQSKEIKYLKKNLADLSSSQKPEGSNDRKFEYDGENEMAYSRGRGMSQSRMIIIKNIKTIERMIMLKRKIERKLIHRYPKPRK